MNRTFCVLLTSINDVKKFVSTANKQTFEIDVVSGRYIIDAKSIMGIFSLDLAKAINVEVHGTNEQAKKFYEEVKQFVVDENE